MKNLSLVGFVIASSLFSASCASDANSLKAFNSLEKNFKERGCGSGGNITLVGATVTSLPRIDGTYNWKCPEAVPTPVSK